MHMHLLFLLSTAVERSDTLNSKWIFDNYVYDKSKMFCIIEYSYLTAVHYDLHLHQVWVDTH